MTSIKTLLVAAGTATALIIGLGGCAATDASATKSPTAATTASAAELAEPIAIGVGAKVGSYLLPFFAESQGLFKAEGLTDVKVSIVPGPQLPSALAGNAVDVGVLGAPAVDLGGINGPVKIIGTWQTDPGVQLIAGPGIKSIKDLKGKKVAINGGKAGLASFMVNKALLDAGMTESDVQMVVLSDYPSQLQAFGSGQADATISAPPYTDQLLTQRPGSSVLRSFDKVVFPTPELVVNTDWATKHRAQAEALVRALEKARALWLKEPSLAEQTLAEQFNAAATSSVVTATYDATKQTFLPKLSPVTLSMEKSVFALARKVGFPTATDAAAAKVIDSSYATAALGSR